MLGETGVLIGERVSGWRCCSSGLVGVEEI